MIFVDSNIPMYLVGGAHRHKDRSLVLVTGLVRDEEKLVTDIEVYQEILHRYTAVRRTDAIDAAFASLDALADEVLTFGMVEIREARSQEERTRELGDLLFSMVNAARWMGIQSEEALRQAAARFRSRFLEMERLAGERGLAFIGLSLDEKEALWVEAKASESEG